MYTLNQLIQMLNLFAPPALAESWDNVGLQIGNTHQKINKILCALDINDAVIEEACQLDVDCIVTHHPFLFKSIKQIDFTTSKGHQIEKLLTHHISVFSLHTNFDIAYGGLNDYLSQNLGLKATKPLVTTQTVPLYKCVVYVPRTHLEQVREVMIQWNTTQIGAYSGCTFSTLGEGTFIPLENSNPFIGNQHILEKVEEYQLSCMIAKDLIPDFIKKIKAVHPYEEVAYDIYPLENQTMTYGLGRIGTISPTYLADFINQVKTFFQTPWIRQIGTIDKPITRVAICSGSGGDFISQAGSVADIYITGDISFHQAQSALEAGLVVLDVGHYYSENIAMAYLAQVIKDAFKEMTVVSSKVDGDVFTLI
jgi:dinuclear metal center YbgI/SA1388 family protein